MLYRGEKWKLPFTWFQWTLLAGNCYQCVQCHGNLRVVTIVHVWFTEVHVWFTEAIVSHLNYFRTNQSAGLSKRRMNGRQNCNEMRTEMQFNKLAQIWEQVSNHALNRKTVKLTDIKFVRKYINNSLHLARKYARIFVRGHYLFRAANSFPRA